MVIFVGSNKYLSKTPIIIGASVNDIELPNYTTIDKLNETPLLYIGSNSLIYTSQICEFGEVVHDVAKCNGER